MRIVLIGPSASGKSFLRKRLEDRGFKFNVSYTTRKPRQDEKYGVHYNFISEDEFTFRISQNAFYEWVTYEGEYYGTGSYEWNNMDGFIMETDGINGISDEYRNSCFIIYLNTSEEVRVRRMIEERNWTDEQIENRLNHDKEKFSNFSNYDLLVTNANF